MAETAGPGGPRGPLSPQIGGPVVTRLRATRTGAIALGMLALIVVAAVVGGWLWRFGPDEITSSFSSAPTWTHPMGTDDAGHDLLARVLRGAGSSVRVALVVAVLSTAIGVGVGTAAGYLGGLADTALMRLADAVLIVPGIAVLAVLAASARSATGEVVASSWLFMGTLLSALLWPRTARLVRASVLVLREEAFVEAARAAGATEPHIVLRHVFPNTSGLVTVAATLSVAVAVLAEAGLSFLGLGVFDASLGTLVENGRTAAFTRPWLFYFPGLTLVAIVLSVTFVGEAVRRALDPRDQRRATAGAGSTIGP